MKRGIIQKKEKGGDGEMKKIKTVFGCVLGFTVVFLAGVFVACNDGAMAQLPVPTNFQTIDDMIVVWDKIDKATYYTVEIGGEEEVIEENYYYLPKYAESTVVEMRVKALGDGETYSDSEWAEYTFTQYVTISHGYDKMGLEYTLLDDGSGYEVSCGTAYLGKAIVIPDYFNMLPVKSIARYGFSLARDSTPDIETGYRCSLLPEIKLPAYLESINAYAFSYCTKLKEIKIPETVQTIGTQAFSYTALTEIEIPNSVQTMGNAVFGGTSIRSVTLPEGMTEINCLSYCADLTEVIIPESATVIGNFAFRNCTSLESIHIPDSVTEINRSAFAGCTSLSRIYYSGTREKWETFGVGLPSDATVYYYSETEPALSEDGAVYDGNYWHYVNGEIVIWIKEN